MARQVLREIIVLRSACLLVELAGIMGALLHKYHVIPYWPVFPAMFLIGSLVSLAAAVKANWYARWMGSAAVTVRGFLGTSGAGAFVALLISGISIVAVTFRVSGSVASVDGNLVLLVLSWPTTVIAILSLAMTFLVTRIYRKAERYPRHAAR